jgi:putative aldouronate transport system substrate-binding protein
MRLENIKFRRVHIMKKVLSLCLVALMILSLAACIPTAQPNQGTQSGTTGETKPAEKKPAKITVEVFDRGTDGGKTNPTDNYWAKWIQEKVLADENIEVTFVPVPRSDETTMLNNLMASATAPDLCYTYSGDLITLYRDQGGLTELSPYIPAMKDLDTLLGEDKALPGRRMIERNKDLTDNTVHSIVARRMNVAMVTTFIRKDWLDKLGLGVPTTRDEWYNALKAFKDNASKLGTDVIPFTMTTDIRWRASTLVDSFLDPNITEKDRWINSPIGRNVMLPGAKEGYRFLNKMYLEGLIDPEFYLYQDDVKNEELIKAGRVGSFIHNWDQAYRNSPSWQDGLKQNVPDGEYIAIDPFVNAAGKTYKGKYDAAGINIFIPATAKDPEAVTRYLNWLAKPEVYKFLQFGEEGKNHKIVNGLPATIPADGPTIQNSGNNLDYTMPMNGIWLGDEETTAKALANGYACEPKYIVEAYNTAMKDAEAGLVVPVILTAAGPYTEDLTKKCNDGGSNAVRAPEGQFDKVWDAFIADFRASGADEIIAERAAKFVEP